MSTPALLSVIAVFAIIMILCGLRVPLTLAILAGSAVAAGLFHLPAEQAWAALLAGVIKPHTIGFLMILTLLLGLSGTMQLGGQMKEIVQLVQAMLRRPAVTLAALPALIGLLPMPGGALFSAPMVESAADGHEISAGKLSAINYWFRHIWEHWWPLYPGVILAMTLTSCDILTFTALQMPMGLFMIFTGLLVMRKLHPSAKFVAPPPPPGTLSRLVKVTCSIWLIIVVWVPLHLAMPHVLGLLGLPSHPDKGSNLEALLSFGPIAAGLAASLMWTTHFNKLTRQQIASIWTRKSSYSLIGVLIAVMVFQEMLTRVDAARMIAEELSRSAVPVVGVVVMLPFIAGAITGLAFGFVGTSFPIVLGLIQNIPDHPSILPYMVLAYACGHLGMMLSPLHICYVVSNRYFKIGFSPVYRQFLPSAVVLAAFITGYYWLLKFLIK